jgi:hypothetical protein
MRLKIKTKKMLKVTINQARNVGIIKKVYCKLMVLDSTGTPITGLEVEKHLLFFSLFKC